MTHHCPAVPVTPESIKSFNGEVKKFYIGWFWLPLMGFFCGYEKYQGRLLDGDIINKTIIYVT